MRLLSLAALFALAAPAYAQSALASLETCQGYANSNLFDTKGVMSYEMRYASHIDDTCSNTSVSTDSKFALAVPIAEKLSIGLDASNKKESLDTYCRKIASLDTHEKNLHFSSKFFGDAMASTAKSCLDVVKSAIYARGGLSAYAIPNNSTLTSFHVTVSARPSPTSAVALVGINGDNVTCTDGGAPLAFPHQLVIDQDNTFVCSKPATRGTYLSFNTDVMGSTDAIHLPGTTESELAGLSARLDYMSHLITALSARKIVLTDCTFPEGPGYDNVVVGHNLTIQHSWNKLDHPIQDDCPVNKVMFGLESDHRNGFEDRGFQFKCCSVEWK